jgi:hypothetical protein
MEAFFVECVLDNVLFLFLSFFSRIFFESQSFYLERVQARALFLSKLRQLEVASFQIVYRQSYGLYSQMVIDYINIYLTSVRPEHIHSLQ